jgi:hypothetical protein
MATGKLIETSRSSIDTGVTGLGRDVGKQNTVWLEMGVLRAKMLVPVVISMELLLWPSKSSIPAGLSDGRSEIRGIMGTSSDPRAGRPGYEDDNATLASSSSSESLKSRNRWSTEG